MRESLPIYIVNWDELKVPELPRGYVRFASKDSQVFTYETFCNSWDVSKTIATIQFDREALIQNIFLWTSAYKKPDCFSVFLNNKQIFHQVPINSQTQEHLFVNNWKIETNTTLSFVYENKSLTSKQIKLQIETR